MFKKIIYLFLLVFFVTSCGGTFDNVKRGLTGAKKQSTDEFFVKKKDPLILPPNYENLPNPDESIAVTEEASIFENVLETSTDEESSDIGSRSTESSILRKIQSK